MALFGSKKNTPAKKVTAKSGGLADVVKSISTDDKAGKKGKSAELPVVAGIRGMLKRPRITEKAAQLTVNNVFTFDIAKGTTKRDVIHAMKSLYKITPRKVNVVNVRGKSVSMRTRRGKGTKNSIRKAYVFLKEGDKIDFA